MRFRSYKKNNTLGVAVKDGAVWRDLGETRLIDILVSGDYARDDIGHGRPELDFSAVTLLPPIPVPPKFICVGLNYVDHAKESPYKDLPTYPAFFSRFTSSLIADGDPIVCPKVSHELDYECELAVVIGKSARNVSKENALDYVAGYSIFNDASIRNYQFLGVQWTPGKNFDGTGAFGPEFVTASELPEGAKGLVIETILNGEVVQRGNTAEMIFPVADLVSIASEFTTLEPGTVIATGTPAGVGFARTPQLFMKDGDVCEIRIEGIGSLTNPIRNEA